MHIIFALKRNIQHLLKLKLTALKNGTSINTFNGGEGCKRSSLTFKHTPEKKNKKIVTIKVYK